MSSTRSEQPGQQRLLEGLAFSGEITASVTHELNNVLGTIEQMTGLVEDLAEIDSVREAGLSEKLIDVGGRIVRQADRGTVLIRHLNYFAHLSDIAATQCKLGELLENLVALSERFAAMRRIRLVTSGFESEIVVSSRPFPIAQVIFGLIRKTLQVAEPSEPVEISLTPCDDGGVITFDLLCRQESSGSNEDDRKEVVLDSPGGHIEETMHDDRLQIRLILPGEIRQN